MHHRTHLLIIDPQNDFCDLPGAALPVSGATADMERIAALIDGAGAGLSAISVTLDSHQRIDIAHPTFWQQGDGAPVNPFTEISASAVRSGSFKPRAPAALDRTLDYLDTLEANGRYKLMVWPVHCEIGSWGHNVHEAVRAAYNRWEEATLNTVDKVAKGANPWTEHYSAVQAEVPDPDDPATQPNQPLLERLAQADRVYICGEASSHCVKATTEHIVANLTPAQRARLVLLTDCMSPVPGFEMQAAQFIEAMRALGVQTSTSAQAANELKV